MPSGGWESVGLQLLHAVRRARARCRCVLGHVFHFALFFPHVAFSVGQWHQL